MQKLKLKPYLKRIYALASNSLFFPPLVVLAAILIITVWPWQNARQNLNGDINRSIKDQVNALEVDLNAKFTTFNNFLQSGVGLLQAKPNLTKTEWDTFFKATDLTTDRTGIQGISYIRVFNRAELQSVIDFMVAQGQTDFSVKPAEPLRETYSSLLYLYPETATTKGVAGTDMLTIPVRREAMEQAAETANPTLTKQVRLIQNAPTDDHYGFLLFAPYFTAGSDVSNATARRQNLEGYVLGGFRSKRLFNQLLDQTSQKQHFSVKIYGDTVEPANLIYQTTNTASIARSKKTQTVTKPITVFGTNWQFVFTFDSSRVVNVTERNAPLYILLVGLVTACLVFLALLSIFKSRARELQQQKDIEVNLAKDELLSLASHQMRTPATGVKQYLGMVLQGFVGELDDAQKSLLEKAYGSNERQLHVINQILHLAKLESGRIVLAKHEANLNELLNDIIEEQQDDIKARRHKLEIQMPKKVIKISIDAHMIRMAIENLLSNAIKYTIEPGVISVKLSQSSSHVKIIIKDTGIGIDQKQFPYIFKQFTRLYDDSTEGISGTGVGLYLADQLVRLHKGNLTVQSKLGEGSQFCLTLPKNTTKKQ